MGNGMSVNYEKLNVIRDSRGIVFEPLEGDKIFDKKNAHVVMSGPGVVRGNHFHKKGEETIAVMGPALVSVRDDAEIREIEIPRGAVYSFFFPPGQSHAIKNLSEEINILMAFNTIGHDPQNPDTEVDLLL